MVQYTTEFFSSSTHCMALLFVSFLLFMCLFCFSGPSKGEWLCCFEHYRQQHCSEMDTCGRRLWISSHLEAHLRSVENNNKVSGSFRIWRSVAWHMLSHCVLSLSISTLLLTREILRKIFTKLIFMFIINVWVLQVHFSFGMATQYEWLKTVSSFLRLIALYM